MSKANSVGTKLQVNSKAVGGLKSIGGIEVSADSIDVTDLAIRTATGNLSPASRTAARFPFPASWTAKTKGRTSATRC